MCFRPEEQQDEDGKGQHGQRDAVADGVDQLDGGEVGLRRLKSERWHKSHHSSSNASP